MCERVLITGVSGFVGGALARRLRRDGLRVTGLSRSPPTPDACDAFVAHDLARPLPSEVGGFDVIVHAAALASPWAAPAAYRRANLDGTRHILDFAVRRPPRRFVFLSTSAVHYAFADQLDLEEDTPWPARPINRYAASKRDGEALVRASGLPWTIVRPRAVFGPGDTTVFPRILHAAERGVLPRLVRRDGVTPVADLLAIDSLTGWLAEIVGRDAGGVFNLTQGEPVETPAMLDEVLGRLGLPMPTRRVSVGAAMVAARAAELVSATVGGWREPPVTRFGVASLAWSKTFDISHAVDRLGPPEVTLAEGMDRFIAWQRSRLR